VTAPPNIINHFVGFPVVNPTYIINLTGLIDNLNIQQNTTNQKFFTLVD